MSSPHRPVRLVTGLPDSPRAADRGDAALHFDAVFRRFAPYVAAIALKLTGDGEETRDIVQEVFYQCARSLHRLNSEGEVKAWLATVTVRITRRSLSRFRLRAAPLDTIAFMNQAMAAGLSPEEGTMLTDAYRHIRRLPPDERVAWALFHSMGEGIESISELCGTSEATVKRRLRAARRKLAEVFDDR